MRRTIRTRRSFTVSFISRQRPIPPPTHTHSLQAQTSDPRTRQHLPPTRAISPPRTTWGPLVRSRPPKAGGSGSKSPAAFPQSSCGLSPEPLGWQLPILLLWVPVFGASLRRDATSPPSPPRPFRSPSGVSPERDPRDRPPRRRSAKAKSARRPVWKLFPRDRPFGRRSCAKFNLYFL